MLLTFLRGPGGGLGLGWPFCAGLALAGGLMLYHWSLIRGRGREGCFKAFRHSNWIGAAIFAGIVLSFPMRDSFGVFWR